MPSFRLPSENAADLIARARRRRGAKARRVKMTSPVQAGAALPVLKPAEDMARYDDIQPASTSLVTQGPQCRHECR